MDVPGYGHQQYAGFGHYRPFVSDPSYFNTKTYSPKQQLPEVVAHDPSMEEIYKRIGAAHIVDHDRETHALHSLERLSTEELITLYQKAMENSDYLPNRIAMVTEVHDGDLFFYHAIKKNIIDDGREEVLRKELLHGLSKQAYIDKDFYEQELSSHHREVRMRR